ncbi:hypothetical protein NMY22_g4295 [Coprinellus aureogranulatus]|nr:hypothetical protein NMY22_g4295 [Coprinellus aureogranulatus]
MAYAFSSSTSNNALKPSSSGLKLVLPSLKRLQAEKSKKGKARAESISYTPTLPNPVEDVIEIVDKRPARPPKLKPLKEVLSKLISQIKKKDDYAFFLAPVDVEKVPGYLDVVKQPMDLGTIDEKVRRGRYRSLEDFASDLRLVTTNAKIFNPPGSIYYTEADKIETYAMDHIARAAGTVLQHETDWTIDIENEDDTPTVNMEEEEEEPMDVDDQSRARSVSVPTQPTRRGPRGPYKKHNQTIPTEVSESIDAEGRLPGSKDGIGAFPAGSDWAKMMLSLKLKGKKYKTKKERLKIEREGPPSLPDGSLDYTEMEDPFTVLSALVPDPPTRPQVTPLYPPLFVPETPSAGPSYPTPTAIPLDHEIPAVPAGERKHWTIARNVTSRTKAREREDESELTEEPTWQVPREAHATDFGSFALLAGELAEEMRRRGMTPCTVTEGQEQEAYFDLIREQVETKRSSPAKDAKAFWTSEKAEDGESYLRDLVYGGVDGYAYVRSLAEFMQYGDGATPLTGWVEENVVDELTGGRHSLVRKTADAMAGKASLSSSDPAARQTAASMHVYPAAHSALATLRNINQHKIDMAALIKTPDELFLSEEEWHGKFLKERRKQMAAAPPQGSQQGDGMEVEEPEPSFMAASAPSVPAKDDAELEGPEELKEVLDYVAAVIVDVHRRNVNNTKPIMNREDGGEDPVLRNLRLNLLALAKRAPLDTIAMLPKDLVPEHIRQSPLREESLDTTVTSFVNVKAGTPRLLHLTTLDDHASVTPPIRINSTPRVPSIPSVCLFIAPFWGHTACSSSYPATWTIIIRSHFTCQSRALPGREMKVAAGEFLGLPLPPQKPLGAHSNIPTVHEPTPGPSRPHDPATTPHLNPPPAATQPFPVPPPAPRGPTPSSSSPRRGTIRKAETDLEEESPMAKRMRRASLEPPSEGHHEESRSSPSSDSQSGMADTEVEQRREAGQGTSSSAPAPQKKKRTRTLTTPHQAAVLHALLAQSRFPTTAMREEVGRAIGLSARKVQIWFQNQRQKARRPRTQGEASSRTPQYGAFPPGPHSTGMIMYPSSSQVPSISPYTVAGPSSSRSPEFDRVDYRRSFPPPREPPMTAMSEGDPPRLLGPGIPGYQHTRHRSSLSYGRTPPMSAPATGAYSSMMHRYGSPSRSSPSPVLPSSSIARPSSARREWDPSRTLPPLVPSRPSTSAHPLYHPAPRPTSLREGSPFPVMPPILPRRTPSPERRFAHSPPTSGLGHSPVVLPPPFTLQPSPQWDPSAYGAAARPNSRDWSRPASRSTHPHTVAASEASRRTEYRGPFFERHSQHAQVLENTPPSHSPHVVVVFPRRKSGALRLCHDQGGTIPFERRLCPSHPLPRLLRRSITHGVRTKIILHMNSDVYQRFNITLTLNILWHSKLSAA